MKAKIYIGVCVVILVIFIGTLMLINGEHHKKNELIPVSTVLEHEQLLSNKEDIDWENMGASLADSDIQDSELRIVFTDKSEIGGNALPEYGYMTLEEYLTKYMNYYWDDGTNYYAEVVKGSYSYDINFPTFQVYVPELDLTIDCMYYVSRKIYYFWSRFNPRE